MGRISSNLVGDLRDQTPKDTSYHSSRWVGRVGGPPASRQTPGSRDGRAAALSFSQQNNSIAALKNYRIRSGSAFVANDGDYIGRLNEREGDFVGKTVNEIVRTVSLAGTTLRR